MAAGAAANQDGAARRSPAFRLVHLARQPRLLVACDYDGTLAAIVPDYRSVRPLPESVAALRILASLPDTAAAVISGRALRELAAMSRLPSEVHLIGSHGSEFDTGFVYDLDEQTRALHARIVSALEVITSAAPGVLLEIKPASVAVHVRQAEPQVAGPVLGGGRVLAGPMGRRAGHSRQRSDRTLGCAHG